MERIAIQGTPRTILGKKVRFLRRQGLTPANIYGRGLSSLAVQLETKPLQKAIAKAGRNALLSLAIKGEKAPRLVMVRRIAKDPLGEQWLHLDLYQVKMTEKIRVAVPLVTVGVAPGAGKDGAILLQALNSVQVEGLPDALPSQLEVDVSALSQVGHSIAVKDLKIDPGLSLLAEPDQVVVRLVASRAEEEATPAVEAKVEAEAEAKAEAGPPAATPEKPEKGADKKG